MKKISLSMLLMILAFPLFAQVPLMTPGRPEQASVTGVNDCLHWSVKGVCVWEDGSPLHPKIATTLYIRHFLPDFVVSVFTQPDQDPYLPAQTDDRLIISLLSPLLEAQSGMTLGGGNQPLTLPTENKLHFKDVAILGNPGLVFFSQFRRWLLPSPVKIGMVYYSSLQDILTWRSGLAELDIKSLESLVGANTIGDWGGLYPLEGVIVGSNDYTDGAVIAERAAYITDHSSAEHWVNHSMPKQCSTKKGCGVSTVEINDKNTQWQLIFPVVNKRCEIFGESSSITMKGGSKDVPNDISQGNYAWLLWRKYEGCIPHEGHLIAKVKY